MTHNQYISLFRDFATNHYQIHRFGNGKKQEVTSDSAVSNSTLMWVNVGPSPIASGVESSKYSFLFGDILNKDHSNLDEVLSDMKRIAEDFVATMSRIEYEASFQIDLSSNLTPFQDEVFDNEMAGWEIEITFKSDYVRDSCQVPFSGIPSITGT